MEQEVEEDNAQIQLLYLTDNKQESTVRGISFPERPDLNCSVNEQFEYFTDDIFFSNDSTNTWRDYGRYQIHQIMVYFDQVPSEEEITLIQAELVWSNNDHHHTPLLAFPNEIEEDEHIQKSNVINGLVTGAGC